MLNAVQENMLADCNLFVLKHSNDNCGDQRARFSVELAKPLK